MNSKKLLTEIRELKKDIENKKLFYDEINRLNSFSKQGYEEKTNNPNKNGSSPFLKLLFKQDELEHEISELEEKLERKKTYVYSLINKLNNDIYKLVLIYKYFEDKTWDEISVIVYASNATIRGYHDQAIKILDAFILNYPKDNDLISSRQIS